MLRNIQPQIDKSVEVLQLAAEMSKAYYKKPLIIAYSGGKDSDVLLRIAMDCLPPTDFEVVNSHTSVDAPETVYHIREVFAECEEKGIKATVHIPRDKDGKRVGCIGCPMGSYRGMVREFHDYPIYRNNYVKAFDRMIKAREEAGLKNEWKNGEEVYLWWIGEWTRTVKGQISIDEYMEENK